MTSWTTHAAMAGDLRGRGFARVRRRRHAPLARRRRRGRLARLRGQLERPGDRRVHGRRRSLPPAPRHACSRWRAPTVDARAAPAALPEPRLQPAERRRRAVVRAGDDAVGRRDPCSRACWRVLPDVRGRPPACRPTRRAGMSRCTSSASRPTRRRTARPTPGRDAPRRRRLGAGDCSWPRERRRRRDRRRTTPTGAAWARFTLDRRRSIPCSSTTGASGTASRRSCRVDPARRPIATCWC